MSAATKAVRSSPSLDVKRERLEADMIECRKGAEAERLRRKRKSGYLGEKGALYLALEKEGLLA